MCVATALHCSQGGYEFLHLIPRSIHNVFTLWPPRYCQNVIYDNGYPQNALKLVYNNCELCRMIFHSYRNVIHVNNCCPQIKSITFEIGFLCDILHFKTCRGCVCVSDVDDNGIQVLYFCYDFPLWGMKACVHEHETCDCLFPQLQLFFSIYLVHCSV